MDLRRRLGRVPSQPDERDWKLERFLASDATLRDQAVNELKLTVRGWKDSRYGYPPIAGSHWMKAMAYLAQIAAPAPSGNVIWTDAEPTLDQGDYGTCVGNGFAQFGNTMPFDDHYDETDARAIYFEATVIDGTPDDPDAPGGGQEGATVRAGVKAMVNRKRIGAYAFASTTDAITTWLRTKGPVVVGTDWTWDMEEPDAKGFIRPTGGVAGGHCYLLDEDHASEDAFGLHNSWGESWGIAGRAKIKKADFADLLAAKGEAVVALELAI